MKLKYRLYLNVMFSHTTYINDDDDDDIDNKSMNEHF